MSQHLFFIFKYSLLICGPSKGTMMSHSEIRVDESTALYSASWRGHVGVVSLLLGKGSDIDYSSAYYGQTDVVRLLSNWTRVQTYMR